VLEPKSDNTKLYVLRAQPTKSMGASAQPKQPPVVRIGPGRVAAYLDVTPIVVQDGPNGVKQLGQHHWAEPLSKGISRVFAENLAQRLGGAQVIVYPEPANDAALEVRYSISQLEGPLDGPVKMNISWQLVDRTSDAVVRADNSTQSIINPRHSSDVSAYVERLSAALGVWADEIVDAITSQQ
jgi:uncharacterized lipoprotein YmbA